MKVVVTKELTKYARGLSFNDLTNEEVHAVKRSVLDMLACAVGGFQSKSSKIVWTLMEELGGSQESTVIGGKTKIPCANAALANGAMVRYLDYNDTYAFTIGGYLGGLHPHELIPAALAVGERQHSTGKEIITAIALAYRLVGPFTKSTGSLPLAGRGWHYSTMAGFIVPLYVGKLLGLDEEQLINAVGISGTHSATLGIIDAIGEEYSMSKNIGLPHIAQSSIISTLLAQKGFTGPSRVIEGNWGFVQTIMAGDYDLDRLTKVEEQSAIFQTHMKSLAAEQTTQGALSAILKLVNDHDIVPEQVKSIHIQVSTRSARHTGDPLKRYPQNKETADHSLYYVAAVAVVDRTVGPEQYTDSKLTSPRIHELIDKITVEGNPELDEFLSGGIVHIYTNDGQEFSCRVDYTRGHYRNPMSDEEIEGKFRGVASKMMDEEQIKRITRDVYELEKLSDVGKLMEKLSFVTEDS